MVRFGRRFPQRWGASLALTRAERPIATSVVTTRNVTDQGVTFTDAIASGRLRGVIDSGIATHQPYLDTFTRSVAAGGWGSADSGQAWTALGTTTPSFYSVDGSEGQITPTANGTQIFGLDSGGAFADGDIYFDVNVTVLPTGTQGANTGVGFRTQAASPEQNYYRARIILDPAGGNPTVDLAAVLANTATTIGSALSSFGYAAGDWWTIHVSAHGPHLQVRAWPRTSVEPSTWDIDVLDGTWGSGGLLQRAQNTGGARPVFNYDNLTATLAFDSVAATKTSPQNVTQNVTDTGVSQTDAVATVVRRAVVDAGVVQSDSVGRQIQRGVADTGEGQSDSLVTTRRPSIADTGTTQTDAIATARLRGVADTGASQSDAVGRTVTRPIADTGATQTDSVVGRPTTRAITDYAIAQGTVYSDTFTRTVAAGGWGTADSGQAWTVTTGTASFFSVDGSEGVIATPTAASAQLPTLDPGGGLIDGDLMCDVLVTLVPTSGGYASGLGARTQAVNPTQNYYRLRFVLSTTGGNPQLELGTVLNNNVTVLQTGTTGFAFSANTWWRIRFRLQQNHLQVRAWPVGQTEPSTWTIDQLDGTFQKGGVLTRVLTLAGSSGSPSYQFDNLSFGQPFDVVTATKTAGAIPVTDTGVTQTDSLTRAIARTVTDAGSAVTDAVSTTRVRKVTDTGESQTDAIATVRARAVTDTGASMSDTITKQATKVIADTGASISDSPATTRVRALTDSGASMSDAVSRITAHKVTDTGETQTDAIGARQATRIVSDTGLAQSDAVARTVRRLIADTGETQIDVVSTPRTQAIADQGVTQSDAAATARVRAVTDAGATIVDAVTRAIRRPVTDTGATVTDSTAVSRLRPIADTGAFISDTIGPRAVLRRLTDVGTSMTDAPSTGRVRPVVDTGAAQSDSLIATTTHSRAIVDTGATIGDAVTRAVTRGPVDQGEAQTDSVARTSAGTRNVTDVGASIGDQIGATRARPVIDAGLIQTDAVSASRTRAVSDIGAAVIDAVLRLIRRGLADVGESQSDSVTVSGNGAQRPSDTGTAFSDQLAVTRRRPIADVGESQTDVLTAVRRRGPTDTGAAVSDAVTRTLRASRAIADSGVIFSDALLRTVQPGQGGGTAGRLIDVGVAEQYPTTITDAFGRVVASGLGTADSGEVWQANSTWSANGSGALNTPASNVTDYASLQAVNAGDSEVLLDVTFAALPTGAGVQAGASLRGVAGLGVNTFSNAGYLGRLILQTSGVLQVRIDRQLRGSSTAITTLTQIAASYTPGDAYRIRFNATGNVLSLKAWKVGSAEPSGWTVQTTDQAWISGVPGISASANNGAAAPQMTFDNLTITQLTAMDSVGSIRSRGLTDVGEAQSDVVGRAAIRGPVDSGSSVSDSVATSAGGHANVIDVGASQSDHLTRAVRRGVIDAGTVLSDAVAAARGQRVADTGASISDQVTRAVSGLRGVVDTGAVIADVTVRAVTRGVVDVGATVIDAAGRVAGVNVQVTDQGVTITDDPSVTAAGRVSVTDVGDSQTDAIGPRRLHRGVIDVGEAQADATAILIAHRIALIDVGVAEHDFVGALRRVLPSVGAVTGQLSAAGRLAQNQTMDGLLDGRARGRTGQSIVYAHTED